MTDRPEPSSRRSLGGQAALVAYRASRLQSRLSLRAALAAERAALRAGRVQPPAETDVSPAVAPIAVAEETSIFASLMGQPSPEEVSIEAGRFAEAEAEAAAQAEARLGTPKAAAVSEPEVPLAAMPDGSQDATPDLTDLACDAVPDAAGDTASPSNALSAPAEDCSPRAVPTEDFSVRCEVDGPETQTAIQVPPPETRSARPTAATDLSAIPELGPGMRHRLAQLGYRTCGDLAAAEPRVLARQLGDISRMLRLDRWIEAARALR